MIKQAVLKLGGVLPLFARQAAILVFSLVFSIVLARYGTFHQFATFSNAVIAMNLLNIMIDPSIYGIAMKYEYNSIQFRSIFLMHITVSVLLTVLLFFGALFISKALFVDVLVVYSIALSILVLPWQAAMQFKSEKTGSFWGNILTETGQIAVFYLISIFSIIYLDDADQSYALSFAFILRSCLGLAAAYHISGEIPKPVCFVINRESYFNSLTIFVVNIIGFSNSLAAPLIIGANLSQKSVAVVNWSVSNAQYVQQPILILNRYLFPKLSKGTNDNFSKVYLCLIGLYVGILGVFALFSKEFIGIVFGIKWLPYANILLLLLLTTVLVPLSVPTGVIANISGKSKIIFSMSVIRIGLFWASLIIFVKLDLGIISFVFAQAVAELLHIITFFLVNKQTALKILQRYALIILCTSWIIILPLYLYYQTESNIKIILIKLLAAAIYIFLVSGMSISSLRRSI